jgi:hypothetical protein
MILLSACTGVALRLRSGQVHASMLRRGYTLEIWFGEQSFGGVVCGAG